jgi:succinate-acetate transporter protein
MNKLKAHRVLLILSIVLAIVFAVLIIVDDGDNVLGIIGGWTGLAAQVLLAISQILEIRRIKKEGSEP